MRRKLGDFATYRTFDRIPTLEEVMDVLDTTAQITELIIETRSFYEPAIAVEQPNVIRVREPPK